MPKKRRDIGFYLGLGQPFGATAAVQPGVPVGSAVRPDDILITSLTSPHRYSDERDELILKWNILQVFYGVGKIFCYQSKDWNFKNDRCLLNYTIIFRCL